MKNNLIRALFATILFISPLARADNIEAPPQIPAANAATASLLGVKCVLRAENSQTKFRRGETIRLVASFTSDRPGYQINRLVQRNRGMAKLGDIQISPATGFTDPIGEFPEPDGFFFSGNMPQPVTLGEKPVEFPFVLNDFARNWRSFRADRSFSGR